MISKAREVEDFPLESLLGLTSLLPDKLATEMQGALAVCLVRSAAAMNLGVEEVDLVEATLSAWLGIIGGWRVQDQNPLAFGIHVDELAELAGWSDERTADALGRLAAAGALDLQDEEGDAVEDAAFAFITEGSPALIDLRPLFDHDRRRIIAALRRVWTTRHFRALREAWRERFEELRHFFADAEMKPAHSASQPAYAALRDRWNSFSNRRGRAFDLLFDDAWSNSEEIYACFAELCDLDDLARPLTEHSFGEPLLKTAAEHAGMRAQVRQERHSAQNLTTAVH
jgi:hypothetical protein